MSTASLVTYECKDRIATITLNRPEKLNAFTDDSVRELIARMRQFDTDKDAYVAILRGAGRAFSSGADVQQRQLRTPDELERLGGPSGDGARAGDVFSRSVNWKPVIAAVHGYVYGMAVNMALGCDLIVAEAGTKFQVTETPRGLGGARYWGLLDIVGAGAFGMEVALTGRVFTAEEALTANIVSRVTPKGEFMAAAHDLAKAIAKNPPLSVQSVVRTRRWYVAERDRETEMQQAALKLHLTEDFQEAARAFVEKREAGPFKGR
jgi:enoyl-CoA hydratase/carnithine racemase